MSDNSKYIESGVELITAERLRQIETEGYDTSHDDSHTLDQLSQAAAHYLRPNANRWPWEPESRKFKDYKSNLIRAGALIAAEIDRLRRAEVLIEQADESNGKSE